MKVQDRNAGNLLTIEKLTAGYGTRSVISGVELSISAGEIVTVIGANGVGKTTLLRTAAGLIPPLAGRIFIAGEDISAMSEARRARLLALCLTERMDADRMNGFEVVSMGRYPYTGRFGTLREEDRRKVTEVMEQVGIGALAKMPFPTMSDGQKQLVRLARACAQEPKLLLLDEPTSYLDISHKLELVGIVKQLAAQQDMAVLASLHELELAFLLSDRILGLSREGRMACLGTPEAVFADEGIARLYGLDRGRLKELYAGFAEVL